MVEWLKRIVILCALLLSGCALRLSHPLGTFTETAITLVRDPLDIRFIQPPEANEKPLLILFATGDGGWRTLDQEVFSWIKPAGIPGGRVQRQPLSEGNE